ncbi:NADP-dependent isocitrate dehydrogenase [Candidatus Deianiraea vastatrix]|uniref:Isocitrate dehydrogenase [NADP] n=1 Tax=Candidatus Deianiraea vastatrix TaxID=2163644 RepID=A0A5B8XDX5_9RICK|nr:NADP-dependent isocitrate dehydrogenase [Candidatus Deianiraea vastatrix]QED23463.1 Isocitrate dehydrogenase [Candidatus Deianiraea vastatrix]
MEYINNTKEKNDWPTISVAKGDGIGPEIMDVAIDVLKNSGARVKFEFVEVGEQFYQKGYESGISDEAWETILRNKVLFKGPITTPQGGGYKSINVTLRKTLGLFANVRPCISYYPFIETKFKDIDLVIIRENEEDLYAGVEYRATHNCFHAMKVITRKGCEKIIRYAFEYAVKNKRKHVTCMTKDNIMKGCDGLFHKTFDEIAKEYPQISTDHYIIDIGCARVAAKPEIFDVIVTLNLYGDIISDIAAELTGSVGLAGSSNIGERYAMFEAIHGSAPTITGQGIANPSAVINAAVLMLSHLGQGDVAKKISDALLYTIESGVHTHDIYKEGVSKQKVSTAEFGKAVVSNLGKQPATLKSSDYANFEFDARPDEIMLGTAEPLKYDGTRDTEEKTLVGVDVFIALQANADETGKMIENALKSSDFKLKLVSCRGIKVYPSVIAKYTTSDHFRVRIIHKTSEFMVNNDIIEVLKILNDAKIEVAQTSNLYNFDGKAGYAKAQGE